MALNIEWHRERLDQFLRKLGDLTALPDIGKQDREFISAQARHHVLM